MFEMSANSAIAITNRRARNIQIRCFYDQFPLINMIKIEKIQSEKRSHFPEWRDKMFRRDSQ